MASCNLARSLLISSLFFSMAATAVPIYRREVHPECNKFVIKSEHYKTCSSYPQDKITVLNSGANLNDAIQNAGTNQLFIVPATTVDKPYLISAPIKMKEGQGLLSTGAGTEGFFYLAPADNFSIGSDPVYCLVNLNGSNTVTGLAVDAQEFSSAAIATLNGLTVPKALVFTRSISSNTQTWNSLHGRDGLLANIYVDNMEGSSNTENADYIVRRSWVEASGAQYGIFITAGSADGDTGNVELKHLVVKASGNTTSSVTQRGVHLKNARGQIEHNYFTMDDTLFSGTKTRILLTMENLHDPSAAVMPTITENYFHSPKPRLISMMWHYSFCAAV